jgi:4-hydroxy-2-oxoglutarate aldolase
MDYSEILSGIFPSITTPFVNGKTDYGLLRSNIERYNEFDLGGYMILGGNGEYLGLSPDETLKAAQTIVSAKKAGRTVVAGAGRESAEATLEFIRSVADIGADIASVITPFYYAKRMKDENLIAYYRKIADESPIPIMIYNSPSYAAGVEISPYAVSKLGGHENIAGMKNSSGREISDYIAAAGANKKFCFHSGTVSNLFKDIKQGAAGATLSTANFWPQACINAYRLLKQGRDSEAEELCAKIDKAAAAGASAYGVAGVKYAMDAAGFFGGEPRLPLLPLSREQKHQVSISFELMREGR